MTDQLTTQLRLQASIARAVDNLKKVGRNNYTPAKLRSRIESLKTNWRDFQQGHDVLTAAILPETQPSMEYYRKGFYEITEDMFNTALDYMVDCLAELESGSDVSAAASSRGLNSAVAASSLTNAHLPKMKLPPFDGKAEEWESFRDRFTSLIIKNRDLSEFSRMHFLESCLSGRALDCVRNIPVTAENFKVAWTTLVARYENPRRLISRHLSTLLTLPAVTRESATELQALCDSVSLALSSLQNLKRSSQDLWNDILIYIVAQKLDPATRKAWTLKTREKADLPTYDELEKYLASRISALDDLNAGSSGISPPKSIPKVHVAVASSDSSPECPMCHARHFINVCPSFVNKTPEHRRDIVRSFKRCFNCLSQRHSVHECQSKYSCRVCQRKHHTMLHVNSEPGSLAKSTAIAPNSSNQVVDPPRAVNSLVASSEVRARSSVLLATAWVRVTVSSGYAVSARALIDQGSEMTFVSENLAQMLKAQRIRMPTAVSAVGGVNVGTLRHAAFVSVSPLLSDCPSFSTTALILPSLTTYAPKHLLDCSAFDHLSDLSWADPNPSSADAINIIIGADLYADIILEGIRKGSVGEPFAQNSVFGWIISGPCDGGVPSTSPHSSSKSDSSCVPVSAHHCSGSASLDDTMKRFWEVEEVPSEPVLSPLDSQCEEHFQNTHSRDATGRYIVRLPFLQGPPIDIGLSRHRAEKLLDSLLRRFRCNKEMENEYREFFDEYERMGHMHRLPTSALQAGQPVFIPHHPVIREGSSTSHLRIVFNASSITSNGTSLNDHLLSGPKLQKDITAVLLQWRRWKFVYTADVPKMYRQILLDKRDIDYQSILWRDRTSDANQEFQLLTVTYGMSCAPFLALRVLDQLVEDEGQLFPLGAAVLQKNIYVDDVLFGADDVASLRETRDELVALLRLGGFPLRKWAGNSSDLLSDIDPADHGLACDKSLAPDESVKILGIIWIPASDVFQFRVSLSVNPPSSKREILSAIAKFYDPSGWITPVTIAAKIFMQNLWRQNLNWDEPLPERLQGRWLSIYSHLHYINGLKIARWTGLEGDTACTELHGFCDASNAAYAAAVFLRTISSVGKVTVTLLAGKSKVAPLSSLSIPRLELCAAVLLARLVAFVLQHIGVPSLRVFCWTDSTVVLAWLNQHPSQWKTFVANRVSSVQARIPMAEWRHVPTSDNPTDCASRGLLGNEILRHDLWWHGPDWLSLSVNNWPQQSDISSPEAIIEEKTHIHGCVESSPPWDLASRFSSWPKLIRVTAYVLKFIARCRGASKPSSPLQSSHALSRDDCNSARRHWIKVIQQDCFPQELRALSLKAPLSPRSPILGLRPYLDNHGIIRVGGRLKNAPIHFLARHPILLASHSLTALLVRQAHLRALHAGTQLTLTVLRRDFWIIRGRTIVKGIIHKCVTCVRERAAIPEQLMGDLPRMRVTASSRAFQHCGIDYAGPIQTRASSGRGITSRKAYIALFICMATKAVHLELVGDYSTPAFLNAFARFCSRRGLPESMYSDNGTTFVGADRELTKAYRSAVRDPNFLNATACDNITWHFLPPSAPHFGGLWEAGVRSMKHHLRRVLGNNTLTFEELSTLLCRIEACLNSRPIAPLTDAIDDYECLTPGHFLIGTALTVSPEPSTLDLRENRLTRWQLVRHLNERFWRLWQHDYVNSLQQRSKWKKALPSVSVGQLVLLRNPGLPPCKWELGRITQCHFGTDKLVRVVTIKTANSEYKRPIVKLCLLPVQCNAPSD